MIPVRLNLRNFMCYTSVHEPLVFDGIHVACLSGQNGHGKSALLDAMTWALWGRSRARSADDLIYLSPECNEMEVEFDFRLGEEQYRVIRKRNKRGRGQSLLELGVRDNGGYRALTGNSVSDTEHQIQRLLRMSYETFTNSSFILQGKADSFTTKSPAERKQILAEILDLTYYDQLEDRAREMANQRNQQRTNLAAQTQEDEAELKQQPELRARQARLDSELKELEGRLQSKEARCETLHERLNRLKACQRELEDQERRLKDAEARAERQKAILVQIEAALASAAELLKREAEIEKAWGELNELRTELEGLAQKQVEHSGLSQEIGGLQTSVAQARGQLEGQLENLRKQLAASTIDDAQLQQLEGELLQARSESERLEEQEAQRVELEKERTELRVQYVEAKSQHEQCEKRLKEVRGLHEVLAASPTCLVCHTELGPERHEHVLGQYLTEEKAAAKLERELATQQQKLEQLGVAIKGRLAGFEQLPERRKACQERTLRAEKALLSARERASTSQDLAVQVAQASRLLESGAYSQDEQQRLRQLEKQLSKLGYQPAHHKAVTSAARDLAAYESLGQQLLEARRASEREQQAREQVERELEASRGEIALAKRRYDELATETRALPAIMQEAGDALAELRELRAGQARLNQDLGAVRQHLSTMEFTARRLKERRKDFEKAVLERTIYQELSEAFGKKGLQVMLIETAIPELQDEANRLLNLMTDGRMQVSVETQRAGRSGDTIETLDIKIKDELGARAYEMYSGGEAFRVNFAIRIALSKLLARRAGARLQTLVIDEGFGSQDSDGLDRLVEAIKVIQPEFEKILVITHLNELRDMFDTRIEITKTTAGSMIQVN